MSDEKKELSDGELDDLLKDLESKAGGRAGAKADTGGGEDDEDIEAFLARLESSEVEASGTKGVKTATAERDAELDAQFAELAAQRDDLPARKKHKRDEAAPAKRGDEDAKVPTKKGEGGEGEEKGGGGEEGASWRRRLGLGALKVACVSLPSVLLVWMLGAYLAQWVSAGWLVAAVAVAVALGVPAVGQRVVKRGRYMWWAIGSSVVLVAALVAPMPALAGNALQKYGHWPVSFIGELAGWEVDSPVIKGASVFSEQVGSWLPGAAADLEGKQLGTQHDLDVPIAQDPPPEEAPPVEPEGP